MRRRLIPTLVPAFVFAFLLLGVSEVAANWEPGSIQQPAGGDDPWRILPLRPGLSPTLPLPPPPARPPDREERTETPRIGFTQHGAGTSARPPPRPPEERARTAQAFDMWAFTIAEGVVEEGGAITYVTIYGNFTFSASNPAAPVTVRSFGALADDSALEARVQYWLLIGGESGVLESSRIVERTRTALAYEAVLALGGDRLLMRVDWDFRRGAKTTVTVERLAGQAGFRVALASTIPEGDLDPGVALLREPPPGLAPLNLGGLRRIAVRAGLTQYVVDWSDEPDGADPHAGTLNGLPGIVVLFGTNDSHVDPATRAQVFGPSTVTPSFATTGTRTLLSMSTSLPSGGRNVIIAALGRSSADVGGAQGTLQIRKGASVLYQTLITEVLNSGAQRAKPALVIAVDTDPPGNAAYTFVMSVTTAGTTSTSVHVQGVVIKAADAVWGYNTSLVSVASGGSYATVTSINTSFPAGSKVAIVAVAYGRHTTSGTYFLGVGSIDLMRGTTEIASNQFSFGSGGSTTPGWAALLRLDTPGSDTQTYSVRVFNGSTVTFEFAAEIVAFTVAQGAYLDTGSVSLSNGSQTTVGSLSTSLSGAVVAIGLAAADNTGSSAATAFNAGDVVLQLNGSETGQIGNQVAWHLEASSSHGRSGVLPLFRLDTSVTNPSYQIKMTARASGINGEAKILAFVTSHSVTIRYSVAPGGNPVSGSITMRYTRDGDTLRLTLSTTYQTVSVDPGSTIDVDFVSSGSTGSERWAYGGGGNFTATITANSVFDLLYYDQLRVTLVPVTASPHTARTSGTNYATVTARTFGASLQYSVWENATNPAIWVDRGGNVAWSQTTSGSTATHRWATPGSVTLENIQSPSTSTATYYEQWLVTWQISLAPGSAPLGGGNYAWARGKQFAGDLSISPLVTSVTDWVDHYSLIWVQTPTSGSNATRRWINYGPTAYNVSSSGTYYFAVQEEVLAGVVVADADGAGVVAGAEELRFRQPNGTIFTLPLDAGVGVIRMWLQAGADHAVVRLVWRGYAVENGTAEWSQFRASFRPASADQNSTVTLRFPRIWAGLGGSGGEIWLRSSSAVTSVIWDRGRGVLYVQSEKAQGEAYFYYGFMGRTPKYIYIDGTLFSDVGYQVDVARQVIRFTVGGGSLLFDFEGKTQPPPATDIQGLVQQLYAAMSQLVIQQPSAPPIAVPSIDLSILARIYAELAALWDRHVPVHSSVAFPGLFLLSAFLLILAALRRAGRALERGGAAYPREVVVVREPAYRAGFARWAVASLVSTAVLAPLLYFVLPRAFPRFFEQPAADFRLFLFALLAAMGVALVFTALILYGLGRPVRGVLREGRGR